MPAKVKMWPPDTCRLVWAATEKPPTIDRPGCREWEWKFGVVTLKVSKRAACAACGGKLVVQQALFVIDMETPGGGWTARKRFLHRNPCLPAVQP